MAEADAFILSALKQNGWIQDEAPSSWSVANLTSDAFITVVVKFLAQLEDATTFALPSTTTAIKGVAARHRVGSQLANILKELGYAGDCGYNHFLYPSEKETRDILSWLVGKLPRSRLDADSEDENNSETLAVVGDASTFDLSDEQLANAFCSWKREKSLYLLKNRDVDGLKGYQRLPLRTAAVELPWIHGKSSQSMFEGFPSDSVKATSLLEALAVAKRGSTMVLHEEEFEEVQQELSEDGTDQAALKASSVAPKTDAAGRFLHPQDAETEDDAFATTKVQAFSTSSRPEVTSSLATISGDVPSSSTVTESAGSSGVHESIAASGDKPPEQNEEDTFERVQQQVDDTERRIAAMQTVLQREQAELHEIEQHVLETQTTGQAMQKQLARQKQLVAMLPQAQANIAKLEAICQANSEKKAKIAQEMELARDPLLKELSQLEAQKSNRKARCRQLVREMKSFRSDMLELTGVVHSKIESVRALEKVQERQLAKLAKKTDSTTDGEGPMTRNMYTSRIMDIIKQVHKQKQDITKILEDIKGLQKQMNAASEKLKRTEAVAEEKLYSAASKSKTSSSGKADAYVECYRKFALVRELFDELIGVVGDVGKKENMTRDLQNWISQLEARDSTSHLDKVLADLESIRLENGTLLNELRARSA